MTTDQMILNLPIRTAMGRADFLISASNAAAVAGLDAWQNWPLGKMILTGAEGAGKTHLAYIWAAQTGARIITAAKLTEADLSSLIEASAVILEDADHIARDRLVETHVFHLHNALLDRQAPLLFTARCAPARWGITLPDLSSRLVQTALLHLAPPDDALLGAVIVKLAHDRQLMLPPTIVKYAVPRIERSFAAAKKFVAALDTLSLAAHEPPMPKHARAILRGEV